MQRTGNSVLIIDDDQIILSIFTKFLRKAGYETDTAETCQQALEKVKKQFYDIALIDIKLPDMEGTDLLPIIDRISPNTVKIMMTGFSSAEHRYKSLNRGAAAYLTKPIEPQQLLNTIKDQLNAKHKSKQHGL